MATSLSSFVTNLSKEIYIIECKYGHNDKKWESVELSVSIVTVLLNT